MAACEKTEASVPGGGTMIARFAPVKSIEESTAATRSLLNLTWDGVFQFE